MVKGIPKTGRVITPAADGGIALGEAPINVENIDELTSLLIQKSEGRLRELQESASIIETRLKRQAVEGREAIATAVATFQSEMDARIQDTAQRSKEIFEKRYREGYEQGCAKGFEEGERDGREKGFHDGYSEGLESGIKEGRESAERALREECEQSWLEGTAHGIAVVEAIAAELPSAWRTTVDAARNGLLQLAIRIARKVIDRELQLDPSLVTAALDKVFDRLDDQPRVTIEVHPEDHAQVERYVADFFSRRFPEMGVAIVTKSDLARGGVNVRGTVSEIEAAIETQLNTIADRLQEAGGMP